MENNRNITFKSEDGDCTVTFTNGFSQVMSIKQLIDLIRGSQQLQVHISKGNPNYNINNTISSTLTSNSEESITSTNNMIESIGSTTSNVPSSTSLINNAFIPLSSIQNSVVQNQNTKHITLSQNTSAIAATRKSKRHANGQLKNPTNNRNLSDIDETTGNRGRVRWSDKETQFLKDGVQCLGSSSWIEILRAGKDVFNKRRTNTDLKDRYRNLVRKKEIIPGLPVQVTAENGAILQNFMLSRTHHKGSPDWSNEERSYLLQEVQNRSAIATANTSGNPPTVRLILTEILEENSGVLHPGRNLCDLIKEYKKLSYKNEIADTIKRHRGIKKDIIINNINNNNMNGNGNDNNNNNNNNMNHTKTNINSSNNISSMDTNGTNSMNNNIINNMNTSNNNNKKIQLEINVINDEKLVFDLPRLKTVNELKTKIMEAMSGDEEKKNLLKTINLFSPSLKIILDDSVTIGQYFPVQMKEQLYVLLAVQEDTNHHNNLNFTTNNYHYTDLGYSSIMLGHLQNSDKKSSTHMEPMEGII